MKKIIQAPTYATDNIQSLATRTKNQAALVKLAHDRTGIDIKSWQIVTLLAGLAEETVDASGAHTIGFGSAQGDITSDNVGDALDEIVTIAKDAQGGTIIPNSITNAMLATDVKVGSLALLLTTIKTSVVNAINELFNLITGNTTNLDILRLAELDEGVADAYVVTTEGTFSRVDGNILPFIPANANTGASTINEDGNGVADIKKWVDGVSTALEEGDLPQFQKAELVWNSSEADFFFAPKGGAILKSPVQSGEVVMSVTQVDVTISEIDPNSSVIYGSFGSDVSGSDGSRASFEIVNSTTIRIRVTDPDVDSIARWFVAEYNNVKSKQTGSKTHSGDKTDETVTISSVDLNKSLLFSSFRNSTTLAEVNISWKFNSATQITFYRADTGSGGTATNEWQVIEFK